jgi:hypothetical protein
MKGHVQLAKCATVAAMVLGIEDGCEIFYLTEPKDSAGPKIQAAVKKGLRYVGVIGLVGGSIETAAEPGEVAKRVVQAAQSDFLIGLGGSAGSKIARA